MGAIKNMSRAEEPENECRGRNRKIHTVWYGLDCVSSESEGMPGYIYGWIFFSWRGWGGAAPHPSGARREESKDTYCMAWIRLYKTGDFRNRRVCQDIYG